MRRCPILGASLGVVRVGGVPGGGLGSVGVVRGGLAVLVRGSVLVLMSGLDYVVPSPAAGGDSGGWGGASQRCLRQPEC